MPGAAAPLAAFTARLAPPHSNAPQIHSSKRSHSTLPRQDGGGGLFLGHPLHPRVAPCWHPRGHMLQVLSSPIVECCPALPPFVLTHSSPASRHCRHSHKALPQQPFLPEPKSQSQVRIQSPKNPVRGPEPEVRIPRSPKVKSEVQKSIRTWPRSPKVESEVRIQSPKNQSRPELPSSNSDFSPKSESGVRMCSN